MTPNSYLKKLGFSDNDRVVIIHTDDIGMCHASVQAFKDLWNFGTITSGATMVPCPWFPTVAQMCRENPEIDMGVHATLNSEKEVNAQIERALAAGIDVTHVDSHLGTIMSPLFIQSYIQAAASRLLPNMLPRTDAKGIEMIGADELKIYEPVMQQLEAMGVPMLQGLLSMPLDQPNGQVETAKDLLGNLPVGITHFVLHPSIDTAELRAIAPDWDSRVANYNTFMSDELKKFIEGEDIRLIGYRRIRDAMRKG